VPDSLATAGASPELVHYATLSQRVTGIEDSVKGVVSAVNSLADKMERRSQTPWPLLVSLAGVGLAVLIAIGGLAYRPIDAAQSRLELEVKLLQGQTVPRAEHSEHWRRDEAETERLRVRVDRLEDRERAR
jgi:hypothetical protein